MTNKSLAIKAAYALEEKLEQGKQLIRKTGYSISYLAESYMTYCKDRDWTPKTIVKYDGQFRRF